MVTSPASFFMASSGATSFDSTLIGNSVWLDGSADGLTAPSGTFSNQTGKEFTLGTWFQLNQIGVSEGLFCAGDSSAYTSVRHDDDNKIYFQTKIGNAILKTQAVFRDIGWYHVLVSVDTTQAGSNNRVRIFVNGVEQTLDGTFPAQDRVYDFDRAEVHEVGDSIENGPFKGYLAQSFMIGSKSIQQGDFAITDFLDTFTFGTNGSQFIPKKHSEIKTLVDAGSSNSFLLQYENSSALGTDSSTNTNTFTATSMGSANQSENTPSNLYPIINIIDHSDTTLPTISEGNLRSAGPGASRACLRTTIPIPTTGKWYWEAKWNSVASARIGFAESTSLLLSNCGQSALSWGIQNDGTLVNNNSSGSALFSWSTNDIIAMAYDADASKFWFGRIPSGSTSVTWASSGDPETGANATVTSVPTQITPALDTNTGDVSLFFPEEDWTLSSKLSGFKEINSANLTTPEYQGIDYFDATIYEGNGQNQRVGDFVPFTDTYTVNKSAMFDDGDRRYLAKTFDSGDATATSDPGGSNSAKATISFWIKYNRSVGSGDQYIFSTANTAQTQRFMIYRNEQSAEDFFFINMNPGPKMFKAPVQSALLSEQEWSNVVINVDLDNSTGADKVKMFVNGVQITSVDTTYQSASNSNYFLFANEDHFIGNLAPADAGYTGFCLDSYLAEMHVIDGHVKAPTDFGQVDTATNRWVAKDYKTNVNTYGNRGFYMAFDSTFASGNGAGTDSSGNNFHFTESFVSGGSAWATTDQFTDTPSKNFATWDGGRKAGNTLSEGNLKVTGDSGADIDSVLGTLFVSSGKYYWEIERDSDTGGSDRFRAGVAIDSYPLTTSMDSRTDAWGISENGQKLGGGLALTNYGDATTTGDFIGVALDMDRNAIYFSKNGTWMNSASASGIADGTDYSKAAFSNIYANVAPFVQTYDAQVATLRTASGRWEGTAPTGFLELNQDNLDDTASKLTALSLIKNRDATDDFIWQDRVMGASGFLSTTRNTAGTSGISSLGDGGNDLLTTNVNMAQRFLQRGVQVGNDAAVNTANESYVLWQWLLGESATTGSSITTGSPDMATTGIVSDANHFSIVQYTGNGSAGASFAHGLGSKPELIIIKRITGSTTNSDWVTSTQGLGLADNNYFFLQYNLAVQTSTAQIRTADITNDLVVVGNGAAVNVNTQTHQAYCFRSVPGLCKVGVYEGNNASDGVYISLGFKPRFVLLRNVDAQQDWRIYDTAVEPINPNDQFFKTNRNAAQISSTGFDFLSDGLKARDNNAGFNSAATFVYLAMADIGGNGTLPPIYGR